LVSELPRNDIGKVLRRNLVEQWAARPQADREGPR
jgi:acyl-coenzyme A synthetase/AMP-(fatty) acid ligase